MRCIFKALISLHLFAFACASLAQDYPKRPVKIIIHQTAGSSTDVVTRLFASRLGALLGGSFVVESHAGAGGTLAARETAKAPPDGYTLMNCTAATQGASVAMYDNPGYDPAADFSYIGMMGGVPMVIAVRPDLGVQSLQELVERSKKQPVNVALTSAFSVLVRDLIVNQAGAALTSVNYKGSAAGMNDLLGGHVQAIVDTPITIKPQADVGKLVPIGISTAQRTPLMPGLKTITEQGFPGFDVTGWFLLCGPKGIPPAIVNQLNAALQKIAADPQIQKDLLGRGFDVLPVGDPAQLQDFVRREHSRWVKVVKDNNMRVN